MKNDFQLGRGASIPVPCVSDSTCLPIESLLLEGVGERYFSPPDDKKPYILSSVGLSVLFFCCVGPWSELLPSSVAVDNPRTTLLALHVKVLFLPEAGF